MSRKMRLAVSSFISCAPLLALSAQYNDTLAQPATESPTPTKVQVAGTEKTPPTKAASRQASAAGTGAEEVIVTGLSRAESLQTAPVSATVFTSRAIVDARIDNIADFAALTPNLSIVEAQNSGSSFVTIRGISQVRNGQSPVAIVVDGVQQTDPRQFNQDLFDIQQIEVLEGPQGAIYGRNAIGGAIVVTTKQPTDDFHTSLETSAGNGDAYRVNGSVSGPIIGDKLLFRVSGLYRYFGGLLEDTYLDEPADYSREYAGHVQLKAFLTDNLTVDAVAGADETHGGALDYHYQLANFLPGGQFLNPANPFGGPTPDANVVNRNSVSNNLGLDDRDIQDASLRAKYTIPLGAFTNTFAAVRVTEFFDGDGFPYTASHNVDGLDESQSQYSRTSSWSDDFRFTSNSNQRLRWLLGGYVLNERDFLSSSTSIDNGEGIVPISKTPLYGYTTNPTSTFYADADKNQEYSVFGDLSFDITKRLMIEFGYRYDWDRIKQYAEPDGTGILPNGCTQQNQAACLTQKSFSKPQPKITLSYNLNHHVNLFTDYGIGFRNGQFNQSGTPQAGGLPGIANLVEPETARTLEVGIKTRWLDDRLRISSSLFDTDDSDPFYFVFVGAVGAQVLVNIDRVRLYGGEIQASYEVMHGLDIFATYGRTESTIRKYAFDPADVGHEAPYIPLNSAAVGAQSHFQILRNLGGFTRADVEVHGRQYWDPENDTARGTYATVNLQLGLEDPKRRWAAIAFANNVADRAYNAEYVSGGFAEPAKPRTYGIELRFNY